jgi:Mg2+ and Co2+ transporter CorA
MQRMTVKILPLFISICVLKVGSATLGFYLGSVYLWGLAIPLCLMAIYIAIGLKYREPIISAEKFADSCYYLGFIFTIASIIFNLFDLPNIGDDLYSIAVRFGAAMVSTVMGLFVRICLVSFRPSMEDAMRTMEDHVVDASQRLAESYNKAFEDLEHFRGEVAHAARETVRTVSLEIQSLTEQNAKRMDEFFLSLAAQHTEAMATVIQDTKTNTEELKAAVHEYTAASIASVSKIDASVDHFREQVISRLEAVDFPEDLFTRKLGAAIEALNGSTEALTSGVSTISGEVLEAAKLVERSITKINKKTESMTDTLDVARQISAQQGELLGAIREQNAGVLSVIQGQQSQLTTALVDHREASAEGMVKQTVALAELANVFRRVDGSVEQVGQHLLAANEQMVKVLSGIERVDQQTAEQREAVKRNFDTLELAINTAAEQAGSITSALQHSNQVQGDHHSEVVQVLDELGKTLVSHGDLLIAANSASPVFASTPEADSSLSAQPHEIIEPSPTAPAIEESSPTKNTWFKR